MLKIEVIEKKTLSICGDFCILYLEGSELTLIFSGHIL